MAKKKKYVPKDYETTRIGKGETYATIQDSMLISMAWKTLTSNQKVLYIACKNERYKEKSSLARTYEVYNSLSEEEKHRHFTMNRHKWCDVYGLYKDNNRQAFTRDMEALIEAGFIDCVFQGKLVHKQNVYRFSSRWKQYGCMGYEVPCKYMTTSMLQRYNAKQDEAGTSD